MRMFAATRRMRFGTCRPCRPTWSSGWRPRASASRPIPPPGCILISAAAVHAVGPERQALRERLISLTAIGNAEARIEATLALAQIGDNSDLPALTGLLDRADADTRAAAAGAILRIARRQPHHMTLLDWGVIGLYGLGMLCIGWYYARANQDTGAVSAGRPPDEAPDGRRFPVRFLVQLHFVLAMPGEVSSTAR